MATILIMEPDPQLRSRIHRLLTEEGHTCYAANQISDGLQYINSHDRVLTVLNARTPWTDSFTFLKTLQEKGWPVLFMTATPDNEAHLRAMYQCSCDVLMLPCEDSDLTAAVDSLDRKSTRLNSSHAL